MKMLHFCNLLSLRGYLSRRDGKVLGVQVLRYLKTVDLGYIDLQCMWLIPEFRNLIEHNGYIISLHS